MITLLRLIGWTMTLISAVGFGYFVNMLFHLDPDSVNAQGAFMMVLICLFGVILGATSTHGLKED